MPEACGRSSKDSGKAVNTCCLLPPVDDNGSLQLGTTRLTTTLALVQFVTYKQPCRKAANRHQQLQIHTLLGMSSVAMGNCRSTTRAMPHKAKLSSQYTSVRT